MLSPEKTFDVIVAGGGTAGCVLASRLSEDPDKQVLLIEAGADVAAPGAEHPDVLDPFCLGATRNSELHWPGLVAKTFGDAASGVARSPTPYWQGYGVGGSSNINGMAADRALCADYDEWSVRGWAWKDVLHYFRKLERELDLTSPHTSSAHGHSGPMPVRRLPRGCWAPFPTALGEALERRGFAFLEDYMTDFRDGFSAVPTNCLPHQRVSAAMAYLTREVRSRPNLQIISRARVDRLRLEGRRATGVLFHADGATAQALGRQIIVSCGAIQTPALLMRSGIGPGEMLLRWGIPVVQCLPGVGANLQNHPCISLIMYLRREASQPAQNPWFLQNWLRFSSNHPGCHASDMHLMAFNRCGWHTLGRRIGMLALSVLKSYSVGSVELASADPASSPTVKFNLFADSRDEERLVKCMRFALELLMEPAVTRLRHEMFLPNPRWVRSLERRNFWNDLKSRAIASMLDRSMLRRLALGSARLDPRTLISDPNALRRFVRERTHLQAHGCGTCRLGKADDPDAVVDGAGRVHGMDGLRVADASIFPTVPRGYPHFIVIMAAEKIADAVKSDWRS